MLWLTTEPWTQGDHETIERCLWLHLCQNPRINIWRKEIRKKIFRITKKVPNVSPVYLPETCTEHQNRTAPRHLSHQFPSMPPSRASTPKPAAVWLWAQGYNWPTVLLHVAETAPAPPAKWYHQLWHHAQPSTSTANRFFITVALPWPNRCPKAASSPLYFSSGGVLNSGSWEDTHSSIVGVDTELNTPLLSWQDNKYLFYILLWGRRSN